MNFRAIILVVVLVLLAAFGAQNWGQIYATPAEGAGANFLWGEWPVTPALVLFGAAFGLTALYTLLAAQMRTSGLMESRRYAKEVDQARRLADEAEASRFEQLRGEMEADRGAFDELLKMEGERTRAKIDALIDALGPSDGVDAGDDHAHAPPPVPADEADESTVGLETG